MIHNAKMVIDLKKICGIFAATIALIVAIVIATLILILTLYKEESDKASR